MASKRELNKQIEELNATLQNIKNAVNTMAETSDMDNAWATLTTVMNRSKIDADDIKASIFSEASEGSVNSTIADLNQYKLSTSLSMEYWYRFCRWIKKQASAVEFYTKDRVVESMIELGLMYAIGFNRVGFTNKDGIFSPFLVQNIDNNICKGQRFFTWVGRDKFKGLETPLYSPISTQNDNVVEEFVVGVDAVIFEWNVEGIPDYVLLIPWLGKLIYFERQKEKNIGWASMVPIIGAGSPKQRLEIAKLLCDCDIQQLYINLDQQTNRANQQVGGLLDKVTWYVPPADINALFQILDANYRRHKENFYSEFGFPIATQGGEQVLAANVDMEASDIEYNSLVKFRRLARLFADLREILGCDIEFPSYEDINAGFGENPNKRDNAKKDGQRVSENDGGVA